MKAFLRALFINLFVISLATSAQAVVFWARPYDPNLGRWIQRDPIGEQGGINLFVFAANNAVDLIDPHGLVVTFDKQPGGTDNDLSKTRELWDRAKTRKNPDGSKPQLVEDMEHLEKDPDHNARVHAGPEGNETRCNRPDSQNPKKGSDSDINFNPNRTDSGGRLTNRDPESSLAHEAHHAEENATGTAGPTSDKREASAGDAENQFRKAKGLPQSPSYDAKDKIPLKQY